MTVMILGEVCNLVAYSFAPAILVTPFGALSVVLCAILSSIFLKERLTLIGKMGCWLCIVGSVVIALNGPAGHQDGSITEFRKLFLSVGFLVWMGICGVASLGLIFFVAPRYGKRWMMVYIGICSLLGGLSVSTTGGLGSAILLSIRGENQLKNWFFYVLLAFVAFTLVCEIIFLNKALELFNTAMVTPAYYVVFTSCSIISTIILYKGLDADVQAIITLVMGFLVICTGVVLLQLSKVDPEELAEKEKEVPGLDRSTTLLMRASRSMASIRDEKGGTSTAIEDPGIDTMRGAGGLIGSLVRARSSVRSSYRASADEYAKMPGHGDHGLGMHQLNTSGRGEVSRYELHDAPVPRSGSALSHSSGHNDRTGGNGFLSPTSAASANFPKRGESLISFTSKSLQPHGHHAPTSMGDSQPQTQSSRLGPTGGILAHPSTSSKRSDSHPPPHFLDSTNRHLSNIEESPRLWLEKDVGATLGFDASPTATTPDLEKFGGGGTSSVLPYYTTEDFAAMPELDSVVYRPESRESTLAAAERLRQAKERAAGGAKPPVRGLFGEEADGDMDNSYGSVSYGDDAHGFAAQSQEGRGSRKAAPPPLSVKQYTTKNFPGSGDSSGKRSFSGSLGRGGKRRERREEEELLSPNLDQEADDTIDAEGDASGDARYPGLDSSYSDFYDGSTRQPEDSSQPSIRVVGSDSDSSPVQLSNQPRHTRGGSSSNGGGGGSDGQGSGTYQFSRQVGRGGAGHSSKPSAGGSGWI